MGYDFEKIGKQTVLNGLLEKIKGKSDHLQTKNMTLQEKATALEDLKKMVNDACTVVHSL